MSSGPGGLSGQPIADTDDFFDNAPVALLALRQDGRIARANATLANWIGRNQGELIGTRFPDLLTVGTRIFYETHAAPLLRVHGQFSEVALELGTAQGSPIPVFAHATVREAADAREVTVRIALSKALDRRRYEREIVDARAQARAAEAATLALLTKERETADLREQFIAVLGHDLRNPVASIGGGASLLANEVMSERGTRILTLMRGSVVRMTGLIENLLDFARGRLGGGMTLTRRRVDLRLVLEQVVSELRVGVPGREIATDFASLDIVDCDPSRTGQLVSNLLGNALTHGDPGQPVRIHASGEAGDLVLWVANGGKAIPAAAMDRLFQPFFRGEARPSQQGLGLGLHIASEIARAHGGTLAAISSNAETRFTLRLSHAVIAPDAKEARQADAVVLE